jgi:hypothetical protein
MITSRGRDILAKYLVGQIPTYASHIAIGCGPLPTITPGNYINKTELDFEMDRFPITSRSIVADRVSVAASNIATTNTGQTYTVTVASHNFYVGQKVVLAGFPTFTDATTAEVYSPSDIHNVLATTPTTITVDFRYTGSQSATNITTTSKTSSGATVSGIVKQISLTAEIPYSGRYEVTEIGLYSSGSNPYVSGLSSQIVSNFLTSEDWKLFTSSTTSFASLVTYATIGVSDSITVIEKAFRTNSDNVFFNSLVTDGNAKTRITRQERPRFLQDTVIITGNLSDFSNDNAATGDFISLKDFSIDLSKNNPDDEIRIAYSLINSVSVPSQTPRSINIMLEFVTKDGLNFAKYHFRDTDATSLISGTGPYTSNRYRVKSLPISTATVAASSLSSGFSWANVGTLNIWASVESATGYGGTVLTDFDICLDGIRIENKSNTNPLYGLVGYTVTGTNPFGDILPIVKNNNMTHQVEFRYVIGETDNV